MLDLTNFFSISLTVIFGILKVSFNKELLSTHIKTCVTEDIKAGKSETVDDLLKTLQKLMK